MDPRSPGADNPLQRKPALSRLMRAMQANKDGQTLNFCPLGCEDEQLDEHGYCRHLVGFTMDKKTYEPMVRRKGRRVVQVPRAAPVLVGKDEDGENEYEEAPPTPLPVQKGDKFEQITTCWRVYRDVDAQKETPPVGEGAAKATSPPEKGLKKAS